MADDLELDPGGFAMTNDHVVQRPPAQVAIAVEAQQLDRVGPGRVLLQPNGGDQADQAGWSAVDAELIAVEVEVSADGRDGDLERSQLGIGASVASGREQQAGKEHFPHVGSGCGYHGPP
jgi:hypothetical protein